MNRGTLPLACREIHSEVSYRGSAQQLWNMRSKAPRTCLDAAENSNCVHGYMIKTHDTDKHVAREHRERWPDPPVSGSLTNSCLSAFGLNRV